MSDIIKLLNGIVLAAIYKEQEEQLIILLQKLRKL
jgi:hypothetical protein